MANKTTCVFFKKPPSLLLPYLSSVVSITCKCAASDRNRDRHCSMNGPEGKCTKKRKSVPEFSSHYLGEHRLPVLSHHGALVAVERHKVAVEGLLGVLQHVEQLGGAPFEDTPEVPRN